MIPWNSIAWGCVYLKGYGVGWGGSLAGLKSWIPVDWSSESRGWTRDLNYELKHRPVSVWYLRLLLHYVQNIIIVQSHGTLGIKFK